MRRKNRSDRIFSSKTLIVFSHTMLIKLFLKILKVKKNVWNYSVITIKWLSLGFTVDLQPFAENCIQSGSKTNLD